MERATGSADETNQMSHANGGNFSYTEVGHVILRILRPSQIGAKCLRAGRVLSCRKLSHESLLFCAGVISYAVQEFFLDHKGEYLLEEPRL
jgi:hypothetical protein